MRSPLLEAPVHITQWLPDETQFSLCSRLHHILGHATSESTCKVLFGHTRQGSSHDIPVRVDEFTNRTHACFGDSTQVIWDRTILPFYLRLAQEHVVENAIATARSPSLGNLKARLGLLASRFGASHPLKACPDCMREDFEAHHVSFWHRDHQWPGAWMCIKHQRPLVRGIGKVSTRGRFHWYLPSDMQLVRCMESFELATAAPFLLRLTESTIGFGSGPPQGRFTSRLLAHTYRRRLAEIGIINASDRIHAKDLGTLLDSQLEPISRVFGFDALGQGPSSLCEQFSRLLREPRATAHPLRHLLFISAVFDSWTSFLETYRATPQEPPPAPRERPLGPGERPASEIENAQRQQLYSLVQEGMSATAAARSTGVTVATAMSWLTAFGIRTPRRPKTLTPELRQMAIGRLRSGSSKDAIAAAIGMSSQTVTMLLRTEPGLHAVWRTARFLKAQRVARTRWQRTADRLGSPSPKAMREAQPAIHAWLYRNDRAWLISFSENLPRISRTNNSRVRWDERDLCLSDAVRQAADAFASGHGQRRPRLSDLCDVIDTLRKRLGNLDQLPLTRAAIREVTSGHWT